MSPFTSILWISSNIFSPFKYLTKSFLYQSHLSDCVSYIFPLIIQVWNIHMYAFNSLLFSFNYLHTMHTLNPFHKMNKFERFRINASTRTFSMTYKGSVYTVASSKVHLLMLEEIGVAIRFGCPGSPSFIIKKKQFLLPVISEGLLLWVSILLKLAASGPSTSLQSIKLEIILPTEHKGIYILFCHINIIIFQSKITLKEWQVIGSSICIGPSGPLVIVHSSFVILPVLMEICCGVVVLPCIKHRMLLCLCSSHVSLYT